MPTIIHYDELTWPEVADLPRDLPMVVPLGLDEYELSNPQFPISNPQSPIPNSHAGTDRAANKGRYTG